MFQFWIFGVILSTVTVSALFIDDLGCVGKCQNQSKTFSKHQYLRHSDCNKYCLCDYGFPVVYSCYESDYHWSESQEYCDDPAEANCSSLMHQYNEIMNSKKKNNSESNGQCIDSTCGCIGQCPKLEHTLHTVLLAHQDCTKYCHCQKDYLIIKNCTLNYQFNLKQMKCLRQEKANCNRFNANTTTVAPPSDDAINKGCKTRCPKYYNALIPHKKCSRYCHCTEGNVVVKFCPPNKYFSTEEATCIPRSNSKCKDNVKKSSFLLPANEKELITQTEPITAPPVLLEDVSDCIGSCPGIGSDRYIVITKKPHKDCQKYCECYQGNFTVKECFFGKFDLSSEMCLLSIFATCYQSNDDNVLLSSTSPTLSTIAPFISPADPVTESILTLDMELVDDTENCIQYYMDNYIMDDDAFLNIPHKDCTKYCEFHKGTLKVKKCAENTLFDWQFSTCEVETFAECFNIENEERLLVTINPLLPTTTLSTLSTLTDKQSSVSTKFDEKVEDCIGQCLISDHETYKINLPHKYCEKYCECNGTIPTVKSCLSNLHFNQYRSICDQPEIAKCQGIKNTSKTSIKPILSQPSISVKDIDKCIGYCPTFDFSDNPKPPIYLPHKQCIKYCICEQGYLTVKLCPNGSYFNKKRCVDPKRSGCKNIEDDTLDTDFSTYGYNNEFSLSVEDSPHSSSLSTRSVPTSVVNAAANSMKKILNIEITLEMNGTQNGSAVEIFVILPNNSMVDDNHKIKVEMSNGVVNGDTDDDDYFYSKRDDLVPVLADLEERKNCIGTCPESEPTPIYLPHNNCKRTCKCSYGILTVMTCQGQLYWNNKTRKCDWIFNVQCHSMHTRSISENVESSPSLLDSLGAFFDKIEPSTTKLNSDKKP